VHSIWDLAFPRRKSFILENVTVRISAPFARDDISLRCLRRGLNKIAIVIRTLTIASPLVCMSSCVSSSVSWFRAGWPEDKAFLLPYIQAYKNSQENDLWLLHDQLSHFCLDNFSADLEKEKDWMRIVWFNFRYDRANNRRPTRIWRLDPQVREFFNNAKTWLIEIRNTDECNNCSHVCVVYDLFNCILQIRVARIYSIIFATAICILQRNKE